MATSHKSMTDKTKTRGKTSMIDQVVTPGESVTNGNELKALINGLTGSIAALEEKITGGIYEVKQDTEAIKSRADTDSEKLANLLEEYKEERLNSDRRLIAVEYRLTVAENQNRVLQDQLNDLQNMGKYKNLKLDGKAEDNMENLRQYMDDILAYLTPDMNPSAVLSAYRIGKRANGNGRILYGRAARPRQILITFRSDQERNSFFFARMKLRESQDFQNIYLNDDVTQATQKKRDEYRSVAAIARSAGSMVKIHGDGIVIDGKKIKHNEQDQLPEEYSLCKAKMVETADSIFFHSEHAFLSNFSHSPIYDKGRYYPTAEHLLQAMKCDMAQSLTRLHQVLIAATPLDAKRAGDMLLESSEWKEAREATIQHVVELKFAQNPDLCEKLIATGDKTLYEATNNNYYGIGATLHSREIRDMTFRGENKLGKALMAKRSALRNE